MKVHCKKDDFVVAWKLRTRNKKSFKKLLTNNITYDKIPKLSRLRDNKGKKSLKKLLSKNKKSC